MKYEVQIYTLCDGFINAWSDDDEGPVQFDTQAQAQAALEEHLQDLAYAAEHNFLADFNPQDYRTKEVTQ